MSDAFNLRVIAIALDNAADAAKRLEYATGRLFVMADLERLRKTVAYYGKAKEREKVNG